jgi:predicted phage tail protein
VSPEIAALDQEYEHLMRKKQREKLQNKEAIQKYLKVKEEPNSESDSESELNEDISPKNKMNKELKKYKIAPTNNNLNKFENYREASDAYDKFVFENQDYFVGNNAIIKEHDKLKQNLDNIENKILKQKLKQVKLEKIQKKVAKKRIIKEGEKIISKKLKEKRIARKQKELEKEQKEPSPEKLKKVFTKEKNKISQMLNKELQKLRRNLDTLSIKAREGDPKAKKGLNTKQQNLKSKIKNKAQELINRLKEIKAEKSAENIENFLEELNFS